MRKVKDYSEKAGWFTTLLALALFILTACTGGTKTANGDDATDSKSKYNPTDARTFGLVGNVKQVTYSACKLTDLADGEDPWVEKDEPLMSFDRRGRVTLDPMGNTYEYDANGKVVKGVRGKTLVRRDDKGRIILYESRDGDNDYEMRSISFRYDEQGRLLATDNAFWESIYTDSMVYEGDKILPSKKFIEGQAEADEYKTMVEYTYLKYDEQGNWTECEIKENTENVIAGDESTREKWEYKVKHVRKITYYTEEELNAPEEDNSKTTKAAEAETFVDVAAFGFVGKVKKACSETFEVQSIDEDNLQQDPDDNGTDARADFTFDEQGRVTCDMWGGAYSYDAQGNFVNLPSFNAKVKRDANGRVTLFDQAEDEEDDAMYRNTFTYDERGRLVKIERRMWESSETFEFTYEGDNIYPSTRRMTREEEGEEAEGETTYRYTKFDSQGNWTERELRYRGDTKEGNDVTRWRGANIERRTIEYYPSH
ncbi:MAG: hypothetical protein IKW98_04930 [Prevotella sp.]|nr:hypothetical protein [Prevotella sp.]